jgi:predicted flap endonuclease-1-like 5' DNA nuclease
MSEWIAANWILVAIAVALLVLIVCWLVLASRRTTVERVETSEESAPAKRNQALIDAPPAASAATLDPLSGAGSAETVPATPSPAPASPATTPTPTPAPAAGNDVARLKGVGPKLVAQLADLGVTSVAQIAAWDDAEIDRIDAQLGRFSGRIRRDAWVEQARLIESGNTAAYESRFGKG